jgi:hypothetical protein
LNGIDRKLIANFLNEFKKIAASGRGIDFIPRSKNLESLLMLGLTRKNAKEEILNLAVTNYCGGPEPDKDKPGEIWEFGKSIEGIEVYIKLKIAQVGKEKIAKCISFHPAEFPLCFPLRSEKEKGGEEE